MTNTWLCATIENSYDETESHHAEIHPAVFAVGDTYQIMTSVTEPSLFWVEVDGPRYYDEQNGIMRSRCTTHRVSVPMEALDRAGAYTVCERAIIGRKPYFDETADTVRTTFAEMLGFLFGELGFLAEAERTKTRYSDPGWREYALSSRSFPYNSPGEMFGFRL